ncbi:arylsulfatase [Paludicola sp. MB14-C6]|uniref:arylsulfatase n=1 Tax=Paludihabitans sp. MB14-C6 TaxID=3070656 RepID=UPI0027DB8374|nr:arylsulfatase [Paludicola sp. MB14-C6]WMJ22226.1 arylsulfatase [Paludicola sp. MB14-C6]
MRPNILFIMTDQMRGDCMGIAGHPDVKTPYLDSLGVEGSYFPNAYTACPSCIAARASLMTGLTPRHTKRVGYQDGVAWDYDTTLAGELGKAGYYTKCVGKMHVHPLRNNLGFDDVILHDGYLGYYRKPTTPFYEHQTIADDYFHWLKSELGADVDITDSGLECNSWVARPFPYEEKYHPTNWVVANSIDFLRKRDRSKPYFLFASFVRPHPPFDAPQCYFDMYQDKELTPPPVGDWADNERYKIEGRHYCCGNGIADPELQRQAQVGYYACITHLDHQIGRLLQAIQEDGEYNNTIIIFTSDHGELLGDHHTFRKIRPYQASIQIPFIISTPNEIANIKGHTFKQVVGLQDIMPTLLDIAGASIPKTLDGVSLVPLLSGQENKTREYLHGEHSGGIIGNQYIVTDTDKFIWYMETGEEQYFNLAIDSKELKNEIHNPLYKERISYLRNIMIKELIGREEGYTDGNVLIKGKEQKAMLSK